MSRKIAILFRTHVFDDAVIGGYRHLQSRAPEGVDVFFCCDETAQTYDAPADIRKVGHSVADVERLGLRDFLPKKLLWYSGDYAFYFFYDAHPEYDLYVMVEYDVHFTDRALDDFYRYILENEADFYGVYLQEANEGWLWRRAAEVFNDKVYQVFGPIVGLSNRAVARLYMKRIEQGRMVATGKVEDVWVNCEAFMPTEAIAAGFKALSLDEGLNIRQTHFNTSRLMCLETLSREGDGDEISHPVLPRAAYVVKLLRIASGTPLPEFLETRPFLRKTVLGFDPDFVEQALKPHMQARNLAPFIQYLRNHHERGTLQAHG